jgi:hypothetical protein
MPGCPGTASGAKWSPEQVVADAQARSSAPVPGDAPAPGAGAREPYVFCGFFFGGLLMNVAL